MRKVQHYNTRQIEKGRAKIIDDAREERRTEKNMCTWYLTEI